MRGLPSKSGATLFSFLLLILSPTTNHVIHSSLAREKGKAQNVPVQSCRWVRSRQKDRGNFLTSLDIQLDKDSIMSKAQLWSLTMIIRIARQHVLCMWLVQMLKWYLLKCRDRSVEWAMQYAFQYFEIDTLIQKYLFSFVHSCLLKSQGSLWWMLRRLGPHRTDYRLLLRSGNSLAWVPLIINTPNRVIKWNLHQWC